jgi:methyl-accepting chemotaxis protein
MFGKKLPLPEDNSGKPKSFIETVITTTPVLMTIVATLLAGLSSSEMTQAQYYRSLSAQYQSKAGDQWGFFQAKRIRGSGLEQAADLLHPSGEPLARTLRATLAQLQKAIYGADKQTERITTALSDSVIRVQFTGSRQNLQEAAQKLRKTLQDQRQTATRLQEKITRRLETSEARQTLAYLGPKAIPESAAGEQPPAIEKACKAVRERKPDQEIVLILAPLSRDELQEAIEKAAARAADFEKRTKSVSRAIDELGALVNETTLLARTISGSIQDLAGLTDFASAEDQDPLGQTVRGLLRIATAARTAAENLQADFKAGRNGFKARCYEQEARQNQSVAELYELDVRLDSAASERHRQRSKNFFYGMLVAQAGVTIASLSLAVRHKSVLWSLATTTGLAAILFGSYVYLCM